MILLSSFKTCRNDEDYLMENVMTRVHRKGSGCEFYNTGTRICDIDQKKCEVVTYAIDKVRTSASFDCHIFADTECFGCGLCDWARMEKQYYDEFLMDYDEYGLLGARMNKGDMNGFPKEC